jgi:murein L,D-transpeptidase YcbB/YkuD
MKVVVGRKYRRTPVFSEVMKYIVINPYWHVPTSIAVKDLLPQIKADENYLRDMKFKVYAGRDNSGPEIDPADIDWLSVPGNDFPFRLRQEAGPMNALGRIKFVFPNDFAVYLHDTPSKELFNRTRRGFSSGCIRLEKPVDLAVYLLRGQSDWTQERILAAVESGNRTVIPLKDTVGVHLLYWTAWVSASGTLHFRDDIYKRDGPLAAALKGRRRTANAKSGGVSRKWPQSHL